MASPHIPIQYDDWFTGLLARRQLGEFPLSAFSATHKSSKLNIQGWCINGHIYISDDPLVLSIPQLDEGGFTTIGETSQFAAIYLPQAIQPPTDMFMKFFEREIAGIQRPQAMYLNGVQQVLPEVPRQYAIQNPDHLVAPEIMQKLGQLNGILADFGAAGIACTRIRSSSLRVAYSQQIGRNAHYDHTHNETSNYWGRVFIQPIVGEGSTYCLHNDSGGTITAPRGSVCTHLGFVLANVSRHPELKNLGARHLASNTRGGRSLILSETVAIQETPAYPWMISHSSYSGSPKPG